MERLTDERAKALHFARWNGERPWSGKGTNRAYWRRLASIEKAPTP